jgi:hypothetical protein
MGMEPLADLKLQWEHETITEERIIGQILQHIEALHEKQWELERENIRLTNRVAALEARGAGTPEKGKVVGKRM